MAPQIRVKFQNTNDAERTDLTRIGLVVGGNEAGTIVIVEPDLEGWDEVADKTRNEILRSGLAAVGVWAEVENRDGELPV